ncbi:MAG TPA: peptidoglycan-binding domain-containing protein, partial [Terriglobia bacterium]|nr:peptidoglycan-binding domain-containing protein [Terriglobia bacterium]
RKEEALHSGWNKFCGWLLACGLILCIIPACASARTHKTAKKTAHRRAASTASRHHKSTHHRRTAKSRRHHHRKSRRAAKLRIPSERASQIQQALVKAGDLHEEPTGRWDSNTRDAMKQYQKANGFAATGLPDAKSLMKMGLGPHALPRDVAPLAHTKSGAGQPPVELSRTGQAGPHYE